VNIPKAKCPFCKWERRAFTLPGHLITCHPHEIHVTPILSEHCIYAYTKVDDIELNFCVCLTCKKGTLSDGCESNGSRWVSLHAGKDECRGAHSKALEHFMKKSSSKKHVSITLSHDTDSTHVPIKNGFVYCFSNESMPGIVKIGMTLREPVERLKEANSSDTWKPPTPYTIEFAKHVVNAKEKEISVHKLLEKYTEKIHERREFFRVTVEEVRLFFDLMDGEYWVEKQLTETNIPKKKTKSAKKSH